MASVYLATQHNFERQVALKVMAQHLAPDPSMGARFLREARIVARMSHRNFVPVFDVGQQGDLHYMSMEYLPNGDLRGLMEQGMHLADALTIVRDIASGLHYAAEKNFVHRDIKPENILFREDNSAVICDFGIARDTDSVTQMTIVGTILGTPHYMSPEQAKAEDIDGRSDLYNLGVIVYEMLSGKVPYDARSAIATSIKHVSDPIPTLPPHLACFQPFINKALAKEPADRFQNGMEMIEALDVLEEIEYQVVADTWVKALPKSEEPATRTDTERAAGPETDPATAVLPQPDPVTTGSIQATEVITPDEPATVRMSTPPPRRRRRTTTGGMRAEPRVSPTARKADASLPLGAIAATLLVLVLAGAGGYLWYSGSLPFPQAGPSPAPRTAGEDTELAGTQMPEPVGDVTPAAGPAGDSAPSDDEEITSLLARAEEDIAAYRLQSPRDNNALAKYQRVLELDPGNAEAAAGRVKVATRYIHMAQTALGDGRLKEAGNYLDSAWELAPDEPLYQETRASLTAALEEQPEVAAAEPATPPEPGDAPEQELAEADTPAAPEPSPYDQPLPTDIEELLALGADYGGPEEVGSGTFRMLARIYAAAIEIDPTNAEAARGLANATRYAGDLVENSIRLGELDLAETQISYLEEIDSSSQRIAELSQSLADARHHREQVSAIQASAAGDLIRMMEQETRIEEDLMTAREFLAQAPAEQATAEELRLFQEDLGATYDSVASARELAPDNPGIPPVLELIQLRYLELGRSLQELGDTEGALNVIDHALALDLPGSDLEALRSELDPAPESGPETGAPEDPGNDLAEQIY